MPKFGLPMRNVSSEIGHTANFACEVENIGSHKVKIFQSSFDILIQIWHVQVAFMRLDPPVLLSWQRKVFPTRHSTKYRLHEMSSGSNNLHSWTLSIDKLDVTDTGAYMCQVGTSPLLTQIAYLVVKSKKFMLF